MKDDTFAGDTNKDGSATVATKGEWYAIINNGRAVFDNATILYGSSTPGTGAIFSYSNNLTVTNSLIRYSLYSGITLYNVPGVIIENNIITNNSIGIRIDSFTNGISTKVSHNVLVDNFFGAWVAGYIWWMTGFPLDARDNWWGDASGPRHTKLNPFGKGNPVGDGVLFSPQLDHNPFITPKECTENCFSNVMFLPGLEASRLYRIDEDGENRLWEPNSDSDAEDLFLDNTGKSIRDDIYTRDVIDNAYLPIKGNIYKSFLKDLDTWKNIDKLIVDYVVAPYDWRLSLDDILESGKKTGDILSYTKPTASPYIIGELRRLAGTSKSGKVTLIAHSNGGLVAKALVNKLGEEAEQLIDKIVFVAVPQSGTSQAIGAILHGYDQGLPVNWFPVALTPRTARTLAQNMPSAYNLLPSDMYFIGSGSGVTTPVITFDMGTATQSFVDVYGEEINSTVELDNFLRDTRGKVLSDSSDIISPSIVNADLLLNSEDMHQVLDNMVIPATISAYQIAGFGEETLSTIKYWTGEECLHEGGKICSSRVPKLEYTPELVVDGDGTVVAPSALLMSTSEPNVSRWWVDLASYDAPSTLGRKHADILEIPELRDFIKENVLTGPSLNLPEYLSDSKPSINSEKRLRYYLHSPLELSAYDSQGKSISATDDTYPGAIFRRFGDVQYISVPAKSIPTIVLDGLTMGSFTLEIQEVTGGSITKTTTFSAIPTSSNTMVTMSFPDGTIANASPLKVDYNGDGVIDFSLKSKLGETVVFDVTPPEASIRFNPETKLLEVIGKDNISDMVMVTMAEDSVTLVGKAENVTTVGFQKNESGKQIKFEMNSLIYDGVSVPILPVVLHYEWSLEKTGDVKMLNELVRIGDMKIQAHYLAQDDVTVITKTENFVTTKETKSGLSLFQLVTEKGVVKINY